MDPAAALVGLRKDTTSWIQARNPAPNPSDRNLLIRFIEASRNTMGLKANWDIRRRTEVCWGGFDFKSILREVSD
jgi:hypothetical protein